MLKGKVGFEYKKKKKETPFETFLSYTDEKEKSASVLAKLLKNNIGDKQIDFLDIGAGNGEYLRLALDKAKPKVQINFVLLEPSGDLVKELKKTIKFFPKNSTAEIVKNTWEDYETEKGFGVILASHLYHIPREEYYFQLKKMVAYLKPGGILIFILRKIDDPYHFKMKFKPALFGKDFKAKTLDEAVKVFKKISQKGIPLKIKEYKSVSKLHIPLRENFQDAVSIIEFYLNKPWDEIPEGIQKGALKFIEEKECVFNQIDRLALVKKETLS